MCVFVRAALAQMPCPARGINAAFGRSLCRCEVGRAYPARRYGGASLCRSSGRNQKSYEMFLTSTSKVRDCRTSCIRAIPPGILSDALGVCDCVGLCSPGCAPGCGRPSRRSTPGLALLGLPGPLYPVIPAKLIVRLDPRPERPLSRALALPHLSVERSGAVFLLCCPYAWRLVEPLSRHLASL